MKVLIVSFYFPPVGAVGAVRIDAHAKQLIDLGHDVRVLTAERPEDCADIQMRTPTECVFPSVWRDPHRLGRRVAAQKPDSKQSTRLTKRALSRLRPAYLAVTSVPDEAAGWIRPAIHMGEEICEDWTPNVIYASSSPPSSLIVARSLSRSLGVRWVAEFRDLWGDNHASTEPRWRRKLNLEIEKRILKSADSLVTVSKPLAEQLRGRYDKPVTVVMNGVDEVAAESIKVRQPHPVLTVRHLGTIYPHIYDIDGILDALRQVYDQGFRVSTEFIGRGSEHVRDRAEKQGLQNLVTCKAPIPAADAKAEMVDADVLLLIVGADSSQIGVVTAKIFEYLGTRRPVVLYGRNDGIAADVIREADAGSVAPDPSSLADLLGELSRTLSTDDVIGDRVTPIPKRLTRHHQVAILARVLESAPEVTR